MKPFLLKEVQSFTKNWERLITLPNMHSSPTWPDIIPVLLARMAQLPYICTKERFGNMERPGKVNRSVIREKPMELLIFPL